MYIPLPESENVLVHHEKEKQIFLDLSGK